MGLGKAHPTGLAAATPSSLGLHLQVPHVQSSQGPAGEGQSHTCSAKRAATVGRTQNPLHPASWLQPRATVKAALVRACPSRATSRTISLCPQVILYSSRIWTLYPTGTIL